MQNSEKRPPSSQPQSNASLHKMALPAVRADIVSVISQRGFGLAGRQLACLPANGGGHVTLMKPRGRLETCRWNFHGLLAEG